MFDQVPQALGQGANDNDAQLVGAVLWALWCLTLSMGALGIAYLGRAAWKLAVVIAMKNALLTERFELLV